MEKEKYYGVDLAMANSLDTTTFGAVNRNTPEITVYSNQGLVVRHLGYYRRVAEQTAKVRISLKRYDNAGRLSNSIDARFSFDYLKDPASMMPNHQQYNTLSGRILQSKHVDAGIGVFFSDYQGQAIWRWNSRGTENSFEYDTLRRVKAIYEKSYGETDVCSERLRYGEVSDLDIANNSVGRLVEHYDTAGRRLLLSYTVLGQPRQEVRHFIKADEIVNWTKNAAENAQCLEASIYTSGWRYNALRETIRQTDAGGNKRETIYEISGQINKQLLRIAGEVQSLMQGRVYLATGQVQEETIANGKIKLCYQYEEKTQQLIEKVVSRLSDNVILQSLRYIYDPVGNILSTDEQTQALVHYKNTKTNGDSRYAYDSFYQLIEVYGIESEQVGRVNSKLPHAISLGNKDASRLVSYQRTYEYDAGGNLFKIGHQGANPFTQALSIDDTSNRGIAKQKSGPSLQESFDGNGNLLYVNVGQRLTWDHRNQLKETIQVKRTENISDKEIYVYDGQGNRIQKTRIYLAENQIHTDQVRYLPGLELREHWQTDLKGKNNKITEVLQLIQVQVGNVPVKALHWKTGKPEEVENDQIYYSFSDQIGSNQLELNQAAEVVSIESYYPYGGTSIWATQNQVEASYKYRRYSGKERDHSGLYYYGYRYYLPWLGRWLNPDPLGSVDGLNLFRMARNNPINFYDDEGMMPISTNYQENRGDLIYGLNALRFKYINKLFPMATSKHEIPPMVIDIYNHEIADAVAKKNSDYFKTLQTVTRPEELGNIIKIPENLKAEVSKSNLSNYKFLWDEYLSLGLSVHEKDKKFNIANIYRETGEGYGIKPYHKWIDGESQATELLWKRGSKLGIEIVARSEQVKLHFVLDDINMEEVVRKSGRYGESITASELRYAYRNWNRLEGKVHFYDAFVEVEAPWVKDSALWNSYKPLMPEKKMNLEFQVDDFMDEFFKELDI